jgi:hypothetical protein
VTIVDNDFNLGGAVVESGLDGVTITALSWNAESGVHLEVEGPLGAAIILETSSDLVNWYPVVATALSGTPLQCVDLNAREQGHGFYRVRQPSGVSADDPAE